MDKVESQGHRLSSYASSSSNKHSPKTPKKSVEKLSTHSTSKEESLSPHHLMSGYSYTSINSQTKEVHSDCVLKCTCNSNYSYNSLKSVKSSSGDKTAKTSTVSCDAATSPGRFNQRNPQPNLRLNNNKNTSTCNELRISDDKKVFNKLTPSPRRLIATRNAATSPNLDIRKYINCELLSKSPEFITKSQLEKSNSLGESKSSKSLRTTRSLSPRPPVRHQHAIMVSDENDIVSVKISPNEEFEPEINKSTKENRTICTKKKHKAQSEQTSPNLSEYNTSFTYEKSANKSTGCLVYVPSDPWLKMSDIDTDSKNKSSNEGKKNPTKLTQETRSLSRGNLEPIDSDPWIWRKQAVTPTPSTKNMKKSPKQEIYRQTKSFSTTKFELSDAGKALSLPKAEFSAKSNNSRPKLQRCKSPLVIDDEVSTFLNETQLSCTCNGNDKKTVQSPLRKDDQKAETLQTSALSSTTTNNIQQNKNFLNVINPNLMQSRHSFSSVSQKDDELQLNIRRLSEQIKHNTGSSSGADFTDYLNQLRCNETPSNAKSPRSSSKTSESVLETTC